MIYLEKQLSVHTSQYLESWQLPLVVAGQQRLVFVVPVELLLWKESSVERVVGLRMESWIGQLL